MTPRNDIVLAILAIWVGFVAESYSVATESNLPSSSTTPDLHLGHGVRLLGQLQSTGPTSVRAVAVLPCGKGIAAVYGTGEVDVWNSKLHTVRRFSHFDSSKSRSGMQHGIGPTAFSRDGKYLCMGNSAFVSLWDVTTGRSLAKYAHKVTVICDIAIASGGKQIALAGFRYNDDDNEMGTVVLWNWEEDTVKSIVPPSTERVTAVDFQPNGPLLATNSRLAQSKARSIALWNAATCKLHRELTLHGFGGDTCDFDPRGQFLLTECDVPSDDGLALDTILRLWEVRADNKHQDISWAQPFAFSRTAPAAAMSREFRELLLIDFKDTTASLLVAFKKKYDLPEAVCFSADDKTMVVGTYAGNVYVFDLQSIKERGSPSPLNES